MLTEVVQSRPFLIPAWAVMSEAHVEDFRPPLRLLLVNTLLVTSKVVDGTEPLFAGAVRLVAFEELLVPGFVFPVTVSFLALSLKQAPKGTHLLSEGHLPVH